MAKLAVLTSEFLHKLHRPEEVDLADYERYLQAFEEWSSLLPPCLQYFPGQADAIKQSRLSVEDEFASVST
jgi:hypothetical protein